LPADRPGLKLTETIAVGLLAARQIEADAGQKKQQERQRANRAMPGELGRE
jgi:hypothetical protein